MSVWGLIVAAGRGERAGFGENKVMRAVGGRSCVSRSIDAFAACNSVSGLALVISPCDETAMRELLLREGTLDYVSLFACGGETRQQSVYNGLISLSRDTDIVCIHDAARPFVTMALIEASVSLARNAGSAVVSVPVIDTVYSCAGGAFEPLDRSALRAVQTPQTFAYTKILKAHEMALNDGFTATDDASIYARFIGDVELFVHPDAERNRKLTTKADFTGGQLIGTGYDAHRLVSDRKLILCGVEIPYEKGLLGHSDADVALHALMDAMLGAAGLNDIGVQFPDSDPALRGISSMILLSRTAELLRDKGLCLCNADITIVAQRPKLAIHIGEMRRNLALTLSVPYERVNVKATTTEGMSFEGEGLGISAQAAVLLNYI